jgi:ABC-type nickel/cobalt efflux system permease component RcnA
LPAIKDGTFWGLGHGFSILLVGTLVLSLRYAIPAKYFQSMEAMVGIMIIGLGLFRLYQFFRQNRWRIHSHEHSHDGSTHRHIHIHAEEGNGHRHLHRISFGVGIIHGLAGSGALIVVAMAAMKTIGSSLLFLITFSVGCIGGMMVAAGILGLPFLKQLKSFARARQWLVITSCVICITLGAKIVIENWGM